AVEALREGEDWCAACGPPPPGAVSVWWAAPRTRDWRCDICCAPPDDDDRVTFARGRCNETASAGCAPGGGEPSPRAKGTPPW
ncbi:MAG: hypothetical protein NZM07_05170, partial [Elioraea sp.]|nr:hypothetical protein [Elioraea sp.]